MKVSAIIPAGGRGERVGGAILKQFVELRGKPLLCYTLEKFEACPRVDEVILVVPEDWIVYAATDIVDRYQLRKVRRILAGGRQRQDSVYQGIRALEATDIVVIHDGVRPFISPGKISELIAACETNGAVVMAVRPRDTIKEGKAGNENFVERTLNRGHLWAVQTPQVFQYEIIARAYRQAFEEGYYDTDDAALVERLGARVKIVEGDYGNLKITSKEDLAYAAYLIGQTQPG